MSAPYVLVFGSSRTMIKRRPTLPTGYSLAGLPAVTKVLHSDSKCELYSLFPSAGGETTLLLCWSPDRSPETHRLTNWLNAQHPTALSVRRVLTVEECPANASGFVLELQGRRIDDESLTAAEQGSLRSFSTQCWISSKEASPCRCALTSTPLCRGN